MTDKDKAALDEFIASTATSSNINLYTYRQYKVSARLNIKDIIKLRLNELKVKYSNIDINYSDDLINDILEECDYNEYGARRIEKVISRNVEKVIIDVIINKESSVNIERLDNEKNITKS